MGRRKQAADKRKAAIIQQEIRCAGYVRVSTEEQAESGLGIEAQITRITAQAVVKGWPEPVFYYDEGISGTKAPDKRTGFAQLLRDIDDGKINAIITIDLSRLGRIASMIIVLLEKFNKKNIAYVSCKENFDTSTPQGKATLQLFAVIAELERNQIAQRTREALHEKSRRDGETGGRLPYGYRRIFDIVETKNGPTRKAVGVEIDEEAAHIVRMVFSLRQSGKTLRTIAEVVRSTTVLPGPQGGKWTFATIQDILASEDTYRGGKRGTSSVQWPTLLGVD